MASTHDFGDARTGARGDWQSRIICAVVVHGQYCMGNHRGHLSARFLWNRLILIILQ
jgi:hypothetical protein